MLFCLYVICLYMLFVYIRYQKSIFFLYKFRPWMILYMEIYRIKNMKYILYVVFILLMISLIYELNCEDCYKRKHSKYLKSSHAGLIRGVLVGCILGDFGISSAIQQGAFFGVLNPVMLHLGY